MILVKIAIARRYMHCGILARLVLAVPLLLLLPGANSWAQENEVSTVVNTPEVEASGAVSPGGESADNGTILLWGDLHVHSNLSFDAFSFGNRTLSPAEAFSFASGQAVGYELKTPYRDGTTHVIFEPLDFISKLAALIPKPRVNLTRFHGVFAPNSKHRTRVTPGRRGKGRKIGVSDDTQIKPPEKCRASLDWAQRLKRGRS